MWEAWKTIQEKILGNLQQCFWRRSWSWWLCDWKKQSQAPHLINELFAFVPFSLSFIFHLHPPTIYVHTRKTGSTLLLDSYFLKKENDLILVWKTIHTLSLLFSSRKRRRETWCKQETGKRKRRMSAKKNRDKNIKRTRKVAMFLSTTIVIIL